MCSEDKLVVFYKVSPTQFKMTLSSVVLSIQPCSAYLLPSPPLISGFSGHGDVLLSSPLTSQIQQSAEVSPTLPTLTDPKYLDLVRLVVFSSKCRPTVTVTSFFLGMMPWDTYGFILKLTPVNDQ